VPAYVVDAYGVASWCPARDGTGPATQVHLWFEAGGVRFVIRLKSPQECDRLIAILERHRLDVWPEEASDAPHPPA
jgi:hypothetical protein